MWAWFLAIVVTLAVSLASSAIREHSPETVGKLYGQTLFPYMWMFLCASLIAEKKDVMIPFLKKWWWVFVAVLLVKKYVIHWDINTSYGIFGTLLLFLGMIGFAYNFPKLNIKTDISHGVYIYHMTVVNALIVLGYMHSVWHFVFVLVTTCLLAWISTKTVGEWSKQRKQKA